MMKLKSLLLALLAAIALWLFPPLPVHAASNQAMNLPAVLSAPEPKVEIGVYAKPSLKEQKIGTGKGGDRVTILEQVGSNEGYTWNYVRFDNPPNLEGWVRTDYLSFQIPKEPPTLFRQSNQRSSDRQGQSQQSSGYTQQSSSPDFISGIQQAVLKLFKKS